MAYVKNLARVTRYTTVSPTAEELLRRRREDKPMWEMILEIMKDVPEGELNMLPTDGSDGHDHYVYGTLKRNSSR